MTYTETRVIHGKKVTVSSDMDTRIFRIECDGEYEEVCIPKEDRNRRWELIHSAVSKLYKKLGIPERGIVS